MPHGFHFLLPQNNPVPSQNALGRQIHPNTKVTVRNFDDGPTTPLLATSERAQQELAGIRHSTAGMKRSFRIFNFFWTVLPLCLSKLKRYLGGRSGNEFGHSRRRTQLSAGESQANNR